MVVVTINILVTHPQSEEIPQEVRSAVLLLPEELVLSEVEERSSKRTNEHEFFGRSPGDELALIELNKPE